MPIAGTATLKRRVLRTAGWNVAGYGLNQALRLGGNLVMTRLLVPEMFGVIAIATMVSVILNLLSDIGLHQNIIQSRRGDDPRFLDTAWVVQIARGFLMWLAALAVSMALYLANVNAMVPVQSVYASPVLPFVIGVISLELIVSGFQSNKIATAFRHFDQKRVILIGLISQLAALAVMVVLGLLFRSVWALVSGALVASLINTVLSHAWLRGHANRFRVERKAIGELLGFGKWVFISSIVSVLAASGDRLLLGALVDAHTLGLYAIATLIVGAAHGALGRLFSTVSLPALSEIARDSPSRLREIYYRLRLPGDLLLLFTAGLLFACGQLVIDLLYDHRYAGAGGMLQVLALSLFMTRYGVAHQIYLAVGMPRYLTVINVVQFVSLYALVPTLYAFGGFQAALWGIALNAVTTVPFILCFNHKLGLNDFRRELVVLAALPAGLLFGHAVNLALG